MSDYRVPSHASEFNTAIRKEDIFAAFKTRHPRAKTCYRYIAHEYKPQFMLAYNNRCAYCGTSTAITSSELFEVDHFICASSKEISELSGSDEMDNLVLACRSCNRKKRDFLVPLRLRPLLHPDGSGIKQVFFRDSFYRIFISTQYSDDQDICNFYNQLALGSELRRIDFLIENMISFSKKHPQLDTLSQMIFALIEKRNCVASIAIS